MERDVLISDCDSRGRRCCLCMGASRGAREQAKAAAEAARPIIVVAKMPEADKYAEPLRVALERANLGKVIGSSADLTVELTNLERGLAFVKRELLRLGVPKETTLEFTRNGLHVRESVMELHLEAGQALSRHQGLHRPRPRRSSRGRGVDVPALRIRAVSLRHVLVRRVRRPRGNAHPSARDPPRSKATSSTILRSSSSRVSAPRGTLRRPSAFLLFTDEGGV